MKIWIYIIPIRPDGAYAPSGYFYFGGNDMKQKEITVLMGAPGEHPREVGLKNDLDALQKAVSIGCDYQGLIEVA